MADAALPDGAYEAADEAFDAGGMLPDGARDELESALLAAAPLIRAQERERIAADPETPLSDALHTLGEIQREAESMVTSGNPAVRECGQRILAAIGPQGDFQERTDEKGTPDA
jgi:hypothetical protein